MAETGWSREKQCSKFGSICGVCNDPSWCYEYSDFNRFCVRTPQYRRKKTSQNEKKTKHSKVPSAVLTYMWLLLVQGTYVCTIHCIYSIRCYRMIQHYWICIHSRSLLHSHMLALLSACQSHSLYFHYDMADMETFLTPNFMYHVEALLAGNIKPWHAISYCVWTIVFLLAFFFLSFFSFFLYWTPWKASYSLALLFSYIFNEPILKFRKHLHLNFKTTNEFSFTLDIIRWTSQKERKKAMKMYNDAWSSCVVGIPPPAYPQ